MLRINHSHRKNLHACKWNVFLDFTTSVKGEKKIYHLNVLFIYSVFVCAFVVGVFRGNKAQVKEYQDLIEPIIFQSFEGELSHKYTDTQLLTFLFGISIWFILVLLI